MTENEAKFLEKLDELANDTEVDMHSVANLNFFFEESANTIRKLFEEIQQYRAIGTVEECRTAYARGYNQGTIDRAEEVTKAREHGYNKAIYDFSNFMADYIDKNEWGCVNVLLDRPHTVMKEIAEKMRGAE